jgi:hypothetical protein
MRTFYSGANTRPAVEAPAALDVHQDRPNHQQIIPFAAE